MGFVKPILIIALRSTINTESVPQLSWRKIRSTSGFIVIVNDAVMSRRLTGFSSMLNSVMKVMFVYLVALFRAFKIKICYHGRKKKSGGPCSSGNTTTVCGPIWIMFAVLKMSCNKLFTHIYTSDYMYIFLKKFENLCHR